MCVTPRLALPVAALVASAMLAGCSDDDPDETAAPTTPAVTSDAGCAQLIPDDALTTLAWTPSGGAEYTVRGCRREAKQGYIEVRRRTGKATSDAKAQRVFDDTCRTLDRTGAPAPGAKADWLGDEVTACAVEPRKEVGLTKVVVLTKGKVVFQFGIAALTKTPQKQVRGAARTLLAAAVDKG